MTGHELPSNAWYAHWYEDHANLADLWRWMVDNGRNPDDPAEFMEKPWKYTPDWDEFLREEFGGTE